MPDPAPPDPVIPKGAIGVRRGKWEEHAMPQMTQGLEKAKREAFDDAVVDLREGRFVRSRGEFFWMKAGDGAS